MILGQYDTQNTSYLSLLYNASLNFKDKTDFCDAFDGLKDLLTENLEIDDLVFYIFDKHVNKFKFYETFFNKPDKDYIKENGVDKKLIENLDNNNPTQIYINDTILDIESLIEQSLKVDTNNISLFIPLKQSERLIGAFSVVNPSAFNGVLTYQSLMMLEIISNQLAQAYLNEELFSQISIDARISNATKDIAKIIESQHEWQYVIPIMGEILDKYLSSALIYIFTRDKEGRFRLSWPASYQKKTIDPLLDEMFGASAPVESDNGYVIALPLYSQEILIGAVVGDAKIEKINDIEKKFLVELSKQCSATLSRAMTYAETVKHATVDALTALDNRRQLDKRLLQEASVVVRTRRPLSVLMMDIDFFKRINDSHGHSVGDYVLREVAKIIKEQCREYDVIGRYGGEEFVVLCPDTSQEGASTLAERIRQGVERFNFNIGKYVSSKAETINVTISIGITTFESSLKNPADLYEEADIALYEAKQSGRNQVKFFNG